MTDDAWTWSYEGYDPAGERLREALCTLGNGYFATRGAAPEATADDFHYPGTYAAGCYDRLTSKVAGREVENEDLVNLPNWLPFRFRTRPEAGRPAPPWWSTADPGLLEYRQSLDIRGGTLSRELHLEDAAGRRLRVRQQRLVHMGDAHLAVLRTSFTAEGWAGELEIEAELDATVTNGGVDRYRDLRGRHLEAVETGYAPDGIAWVCCATRSSGITVAMAARLRSSSTGTCGPSAEPCAKEGPRSSCRVAQRLVVPLLPGAAVHVDKTVALFTSRDRGIGAPRLAAVDAVSRAPHFSELLASHRRAWKHLWERTVLDVPGLSGRVLRLHLFHVLQTLSPHSVGIDAGVPARGLHGEAYRGHVFWDELFVLPYLNLHLPEVSRAMLSYRHRRLPAACRNAEDAGFAGAMYPWQSASDGREESPALHLNPRSRRWLPDRSHLQRHVGSAVAYNLWRYAEATGDLEFLHTQGAEMLLRIARFWSSTAAFDPDRERYRIRGVVGPDEYHDAYPDSDRAGIDDNAYTNATASWVLSRALELARALPQPRRDHLFADMALDEEELRRWEDVSRRLLIPFHENVISQFDGYEALTEFGWDRYRARYGDVRRLDRILEAEGDTVNRYRASKQADVLMLGYLFPPRELSEVFRRLGYVVDDDMWDRTVDYYLSRTSHGSTLSGLVHGWILARERRPEAWRYTHEALWGDVADLQGGTTHEGIHLGAMGGTLDLVQRGLTGLEIHDGTLHLDPAPLTELSDYGFSIRFRGHWGITFRLCGDTLEVGLPAAERGPLRVGLRDEVITVHPGETRTLDLS
ncbi:glycoside hydrolase family 65 protein [Streptomyces axinellae]|uniref:Glycosyl hydrolase family 65 protein n=1 Tax=Streptomyces axinellae TaxID=552788 RepID=A0ABP6C0H8_9ACTN